MCIGPQFRGSNAAGLFKSLATHGHIISIIDEFYYIPLLASMKRLKLINRIFRNLYIKNFNDAIVAEFNKFKPDVVLVYKGAFILPITLNTIKNNALLLNFYPDVSFHTHGPYLKQSLKLYDHIFTTKKFGISDLREQLGIDLISFIPHGFDPDIHRNLSIPDIEFDSLKCDVSFIGTWSPKKEKTLSYLKSRLPDISLKIWGNQWEKSISDNLKNSIQGYPVEGDLYAYAILSSKINLGILSEKVRGASSGDKITSRTFHIPAVGGFMIHERNEESITYFEEDKEVVFFDTQDELFEKVSYYLGNLQEVEQIADRGYLRAHKDHSLDERAKQMIEIVEKIQRKEL